MPVLTSDLFGISVGFVAEAASLRIAPAFTLAPRPVVVEMMKSDVSLNYTGEEGENCLMRNMLPLYMGDGPDGKGAFERTFCCYGNDVDCARCGAYAVFNAAYKKERSRPQAGDVD